jgi:hypothetical protein
MVAKKKPPQGSEFWQIIFPTVVGAMVVLSLGIWFGLTGTSGNLARFAEISTVLLIIPVVLAALLFGLLLFGLTYLVGRLITGIPPLTERILKLLEKIREGTTKATRSAASLVIEPAALLAIFRPKQKHQDSEISLND